MTRRSADISEILHPVVRRVVTALLVISVVVPLIYMLILSVSPDVEISAGVVFPTQLVFQNYVTMWTAANLGQGLINSVIICGAASLGAVIVGSLAGYVSARVRFRGQGVFMSSLLAFQTVPTVMTLLPLFIVMAGLQSLLHFHIIGSYWSVALAYLTFALPLVTWFVASYVESVPRDLEEAARIDGAGAIRIFFQIVLPLIGPATAVAGVLSFLTGWGDLLIASVLSGPGTNTVTVALQSFLSTQQTGTIPAYGVLMAASVVSALPVIILYLSLQRFVVAGMTGGAVRG
jgi:ABC-type glycerol-3-phosphate transport system permease component